MHDIWLRLSEEKALGVNLHHRDIVGVALRRLEHDLTAERREEIFAELLREQHRE